jgi:hypothetical protein
MDFPDKNTLLISAGLLLVGAVAYQAMRVKQAIADTHSAGRDAIKPVTDAAFNLYSLLKGKPVMVESTYPGFVLNERYIKPDGTIDSQWRQNITLMHPGNGELFSLITNERGQLLQSYRHLINKIVDKDSTQ